MAGTYDSEQQRMIDRIRCIAFREARDAGATFINRQWVAEKVHRTTRFVTEWWEKSYDRCFADYSNAGPKLKLSPASQDIIFNASGKQKKVVLLWRRKLLKDMENTWLAERLIITDTEKD